VGAFPPACGIPAAFNLLTRPPSKSAMAPAAVRCCGFVGTTVLQGSINCLPSTLGHAVNTQQVAPLRDDVAFTLPMLMLELTDPIVQAGSAVSNAVQAGACCSLGPMGKQRPVIWTAGLA
jgi:hypothetical protein